MPQEKHMHQCHQKDLFHHGVSQGIRGVIDQFTAVVERNDFHSGWKSCRKRRDFGFHIAYNLSRICARTADHNSADGINSILMKYTTAKFRPHLYRSQLANGHRVSVEM